jgi:hypothetical protein
MQNSSASNVEGVVRSMRRKLSLQVLGLMLAPPLALALLPGAASTPCTPPQTACGCGCCSPGSGTSRQAYSIAQSVVDGFADDAELRTIVSSTGVNLEGQGIWTFEWYSRSRGATFAVTVQPSGATSTSQNTVPAPGPGVTTPAPANWADSAVVVAATKDHRPLSVTQALPVFFNVTSYPQAAAQAVWALGFSGGNSELVSATGGYIGILADSSIPPTQIPPASAHVSRDASATVATFATLASMVVPAGSYTKTCQNISVDSGTTLRASCRRRNGSWNNASLGGFYRCGGDISNQNGNLACSMMPNPCGIPYDKIPGYCGATYKDELCAAFWKWNNYHYICNGKSGVLTTGWFPKSFCAGAYEIDGLNVCY